MCGIAGIVGLSTAAPVDARDIVRMCNAIVHRGPDDEGIWLNSSVGLGMRRLSIIDVTGGQQPIHNEDQSIWIVFNGEIYNFLELRHELESRGHEFYTHSDTEVIVHLYEDFGAASIGKLRGMFGIAIYDLRQKKLLLARDRLGKKPVHYALCGDRLFFGSEIKSILAVAPQLAQVAPEHLIDYFRFGYIPDPYTAFKDIHKLPPAHVLEFENGNLSTRAYWDIPQYGTAVSIREEEHLELLENTLDEATRMRLISEVPLGALLSGGVDSSTVVALMARHSSKPVKTFSIGFSHQDFNEAQHARLVARKFQTEHHELIVEPRIGESLEYLTQMLEEPFADSSIIPTYYVSKMARKHVTVALAGDGGDELFAGYDRYRKDIHRNWFRVPALLGRAYRRAIYPRLPRGVRGRRFVYNMSLPPAERYLDGLSFLTAGDRDRELFSTDFISTFAADTGADRFRSILKKAPANDLLGRMLYLDTKTYLPADILTKVDRMSMATSLEVRAPILDHVFVEHVAAIPSAWKLRKDEQKYLFKKLAVRVGVPEEVVYRRKQGFSLPLVHWMRNEFRGEIARILLEPRATQRGYFNPTAVRRLVEEHETGTRDRSGEIWTLLMFELWHRNFLERSAAEVSGLPGSRPTLGGSSSLGSLVSTASSVQVGL